MTNKPHGKPHQRQQITTQQKHETNTHHIKQNTPTHKTRHINQNKHNKNTNNTKQIQQTKQHTKQQQTHTQSNTITKQTHKHNNNYHTKQTTKNKIAKHKTNQDIHNTTMQTTHYIYIVKNTSRKPTQTLNI